MNEEERKAIEELEKFIKGPCETCKYCEGAYKLNRKNIIQLLNLTKKLQKENEELKETYKSEKKMKNEYVKLYQDLLLKENVIPIQKVKDKIEKYKNMLKTCNKAKDIDRIKAINERILELQELIEEREGE